MSWILISLLIIVGGAALVQGWRDGGIPEELGKKLRRDNQSDK